MSDYNVKNYTEQGGDVTHIGGKLVFDEGAQVDGLPSFPALAVNQEASTASQVSALKNDFNALLTKLKNAGLMTPDAWNVSVLACLTPAAMPTAETAANSGHATVSIEEGAITVTLDCKVSGLSDANHGESWGTHKWLGFGVRTGLASIVGIQFTDDTGAKATLASADATEAEALGLSAGDFILYIKAEDTKYLTGEKSFTLWADGYAKTTFTMQIVETSEQAG